MENRLRNNRKYGKYDECDSSVLALFSYWPWVVLVTIIIIGWLVIDLTQTLLALCAIVLGLTLFVRKSTTLLFDRIFPRLNGVRAECHSVYTEGIDYRVIPDE